MPMNKFDMSFASAFEVAGAIRRGEVTSLELTHHILQRIE